MTDDLNVSVFGGIGVVEIDRGPANHFDQALLAKIADTGERLQNGRNCRVIVLCSAGKHFCAGADFGTAEMHDDRELYAAALYRQGARLFDLEIPIVAAVHGAAVGGGLGLACAADFRVASEAARFQANFAKLGFHHGFALTVTLPRIVGEQRALDMLLTARPVRGKEAHALGLVDRLVEVGSERAGAMALAAQIAVGAPLAVRSMRQTMRGSLREEVRRCLDRELSEQVRLWKTRDSKVGIAASLDRTVPQFTGE